MGYYQEKLNELRHLYQLVRSEEQRFQQVAQLEREELDATAKRLANERNHLDEAQEAIKVLAEEKSEGFPWLARAYADYFHLQDLRMAENLRTKEHPAPKAAEELTELARKRRAAEVSSRILKYQLEYYEQLFPWLIEFKGEEVDDLTRQILTRTSGTGKGDEEPVDAARKWLTQSEYEQLPPAAKYQLALDRYWKKRKNKWELGRDYERYVGFQYESQGYGVYYQGIVEGLADLGRDLVCTKGQEAIVVQCKRWSSEKRIHEKHICQLHGTIVAYALDHPQAKVSGRFVTSTSLSSRAREFAAHLGITVSEQLPMADYPSIKCNVSRRTGERIYHLPFDQQYDRTIVEEERNEYYVNTVADAEARGFRRALRWHGPTSDTAVNSMR